MTARRMTTTLGAFALGIATIGVGPAMAQMGGAGPAGMPPGAGPAGMATAPGMPGAPMTTPGGMAQPPGAAAGMTRPGAGAAGMARPHVGRALQGQPMQSRRNRTMRRSVDAEAANPEVDRLNEQSLDAARKNETFTPTAPR